MPEFNLYIIFFLATGFLISVVISIRYPLLFTVLLISLNERIFGLLPNKFGSGELDLIRFSGAAILICAIAIQFTLFPRNFNSSFRKGPVKGRYLKFILIIVGLVVFCTLWGGLVIYDQPIRSLVLRPTVFYYYFVYIYLSFFKIDLEQIIHFFNMIFILAIILAVLAGIDAFFFGGTKIFAYSHTSERIGVVRKGVFILGIIWAYYYALSKAFNKKLGFNKKAIYTACAVMFFSYLAFVLVARQVLLSCILATSIIFFTRGFIKSFVLSIILCFFILFSYVQNDYNFSKTYIGKMYDLSEKETIEQKGNIGIRMEAIQYYFQHFKKSYGMGFGIMSGNTKYSNPVSKGLANYGYNLNDLSLSGIIFQFGVLAFFIIIFLSWKILKDCRLLMIRGDDSVQPIVNSIKYFTIHLIIIFPLTTVFFYKEQTIYFAIFFYILDRLKYLQQTPSLSKVFA